VYRWTFHPTIRVLQRFLILSASCATLACGACGRDSRALADTTDSLRTDSAGGDVRCQRPAFPRRDTDTVRDTTVATQAGAPCDTTKADSTAAKGDTAAAARITVRVPAGRAKKDSLALVSLIRAGTKSTGWPVKATVAPGSLLPDRRIIAFYGNPLSKKMGILGELPPPQMLARLDSIIAQWKAADPATPIQPALHLIAVVAQGAPGRDGKYRLRMDSTLIEQVYGWAQQKNALLFLDIQGAQSTIQEELPRLLPFLARPNVMLGLDPEFYMHYDREGVAPGLKIGTMTSKEVNYAIQQLKALVVANHLPPKILVVHRFTRPMLRGASEIQLDPSVQVVVDMDGWGQPWLKYDSYKDYVVSEPVQYTGFKLFFKNDTKKGDRLLTPMEVLQLKPRPVYIQYQ
jgi:hypothetical protein